MKDESEDKTKRFSFLAAFTEISALLAVAAIGVYVVGLFALWITISRTFTNDFSTAWYAVSLVPREVVAGQGVRQVLWYPTFSLMLLISMYVLTGFLRGVLRIREITAALTVVIIFLVLTMFWMISLILSSERTAEPFARSNLVEAGISTLGLFIVIAGGILAGTRINSALEFTPDHYLPKVIDVRTLFRGVGVSIASVLIMALLNASIMEPPLPGVQFSNTKVDEGRLLTNSPYARA